LVILSIFSPVSYILFFLLSSLTSTSFFPKTSLASSNNCLLSLSPPYGAPVFACYFCDIIANSLSSAIFLLVCSSFKAFSLSSS
jgi:hypothetical protein